MHTYRCRGSAEGLEIWQKSAQHDRQACSSLIGLDALVSTGATGEPAILCVLGHAAALPLIHLGQKWACQTTLNATTGP